MVTETRCSVSGKWRASVCEDTENAYLIFEKDPSNKSSNNLYRYQIESQKWTTLDTFPGTGRSYASIHQANNQLYVLFGIDSLTVYKEVWLYDLKNKLWKQQSDLPPFARKGGMCFGTENTLYYTTGIDQNGNKNKQTWKFDLLTAVYQTNPKTAPYLYPNPVHNLLHIHSSTLFDDYQILHVLGVIQSKGSLDKTQTIDISGMLPGNYILNVISNDAIKVIVFEVNSF